jgi:cytochrome c oxidase subunit 4
VSLKVIAMSEHIVPLKTNVAVWLTLLVLTGVTAGVAFIDLGAFNTVVALVIATCKALLVVLIFMHVKYASEKLVKVVVISALFFLMLLLGLSLADYTTRLL